MPLNRGADIFTGSCAHRIHFVDRAGEFLPSPSLCPSWIVQCAPHPSPAENADVYRLLMMEPVASRIFTFDHNVNRSKRRNAFDRAIIVYPGYYV